jgi:hypothetical protein
VEKGLSSLYVDAGNPTVAARQFSGQPPALGRNGLMRTVILFGSLLATLTGAAPALACSAVSNFDAPTNLGLVADAELVLLGRVAGEAKTADARDTALLVEPVLAIKGTLPAKTIAVADAGLVPEDRPDFAVLSNPYELVKAHPLSYIGGCIRYMFPLGTRALFFLERDEDGGGWRPSGNAFSRWAEDVLSDDSPWLRLTRFYAKVAAAPEGERNAMLEAESERLGAMAADPVAQLIAADIDRQLGGSKPTWHERMEREMEARRKMNDLPEEEAGQAEAMEEPEE